MGKCIMHVFTYSLFLYAYAPLVGKRIYIHPRPESICYAICYLASFISIKGLFVGSHQLWVMESTINECIELLLWRCPKARLGCNSIQKVWLANVRSQCLCKHGDFSQIEQFTNMKAFASNTFRCNLLLNILSQFNQQLVQWDHFIHIGTQKH